MKDESRLLALRMSTREETKQVEARTIVVHLVDVMNENPCQYFEQRTEQTWKAKAYPHRKQSE